MLICQCANMFVCQCVDVLYKVIHGSNITNRYIDAFPLAQQMEFNSRLLKLNDDTDILEELKGLTPEQLKVLIALAKNA